MPIRGAGIEARDPHGPRPGGFRQPDRDITALLPRLLADVKRPGDFYGTGEVLLPVVRLAVDGVGILGLPLPPVQVEAQARVAAPAPYGRGGDTLVDPAVRRCGHLAATDALREACLVHLRARIALSLAPPDDVARSTDGLTCNCANCSALRSFLADPVATTWTLNAAAPQRARVEESIRRARCDVDFRTERRGARTPSCATRIRRATKPGSGSAPPRGCPCGPDRRQRSAATMVGDMDTRYWREQAETEMRELL